MKNKNALLLLAILVAVCATYANHFQNGFHFDDFHTVTDNPYIRDLRNIPRFFRDTTTFSVLPANRTYRPFVSMSLAIDYALGRGLIPFWFHLSTFLVFLGQLALMAWLFVGVLDRAASSPGAPASEPQRARNRLAALVAVAWYGLHPAIAETVNYIIQRGDIFSACGVVASLALYVNRPRWRRWQLYLIPFAIALLSKPPALVFPLILFFYIFLFEESPRRARHALWQTLPSLVVCAALLALQSAMTPKSYLPSMHSPWSYRITQPYVWLRYVGALFLPIHLNVDTDLFPFAELNGRAVAGFVFVALLFAAIVATARPRQLRPISFGLAWFAFAQLPTSLYSLSEVENDHRMYFAFVGLVLAVVWAGALLQQAMLRRLEKYAPLPRWRTATAVKIVLLLCAYAGGTFARNQVWRSEETLWKDDVEKSPNNSRGLMNYGLTLMSRGDYTGALDLFTRAIPGAPNYPSLEINLGIACDGLNRLSDAEHHFQRAIALSPGNDETHFYYARSLFNHQRLAEARREAEQAISLNPSRLEPQHLLMQINAALGDTAGARAVAMGALQLAPGDETARKLADHPAEDGERYWVELSLRQYQQKQFAECIASARRVLAINPKSAEAYNNIAAAYAEQKQWDEAIAAAREAVRLAPDFQLAKNNLAWVLSGKGSGGH